MCIPLNNAATVAMPSIFPSQPYHQPAQYFDKAYNFHQIQSNMDPQESSLSLDAAIPDNSNIGVGRMPSYNPPKVGYQVDFNHDVSTTPSDLTIILY